MSETVHRFEVGESWRLCPKCLASWRQAVSDGCPNGCVISPPGQTTVKVTSVDHQSGTITLSGVDDGG